MRTFIIAASSLALGLAICLTRASATQGVTYIPADEVAAGFAKGAVLVNHGTYQVHASRRDAAGQAEVHEHETDIIYMLAGSTTFVTGGTVEGGATTAPGEIRGSGVSGGDARTLAKGDLVIVPKGTPHWFKDVSGPVLYYVVKVQ